eukprot:TRINITY_DN22992_c0_g1_i3.p1 TRINITY_DN22992_c0_g1~~TRINITY_DN22992_c0_g1_i3.p1  ORF type:complete len:455 (+),score=56.50 TRINITY_DN22992_c0_g1_i3:130-1494(+)
MFEYHFSIPCLSVHIGVVLSIVGLFCWRKEEFWVNKTCSFKSQFVVIIDAGSSGSRVHVYEWKLEQNEEEWENRGGVEEKLSVVLPEPTIKNDVPLSSYVQQPKNAGKSLKKLVQFSKHVVPRCQIQSTPVLLMATAGLRLLPSEIQNQILESCRQILKKSGFQTRSEWVRIIDGKEEATFAYLAVNYLFGQVVSDYVGEGKKCRQLVGVFELGGASFQAAFQATEDVAEQHQIDASLLGVGLHLYANSFLSLGLDEAFIQVHKWVGEHMAQQSSASPCVPRGGEVDSFTKGTGNFKGCRKLLNVFYQRHEPCIQQQQPGNLEVECNLNGQQVPDAKLVSKGAIFVATENFFYTIKILNLPTDASLAEVEQAGKNFCRLSWQQLQRRYRHVPERYLLKTCFGAVLIIQLLHDSFGIPMDERGRVLFVNKVNDVSLDWTLGALVQQLNRSNNQYD